METNKKTMSEQEILKGNKLIAEFLGIEKKIYGETGITYYIDNIPYQLFKLKYHSSWDWLMPVVEKIEKLSTISFECKYYDPDYKREDYEVKSFYFIYSYSSQNKKFIANSNNKLEAYWLAVVEFIKYYNSCQK